VSGASSLKGEPSNKELKLTKPSIMELRSLTPVLCGPADERRGGGLKQMTVGVLAALFLAACEPSLPSDLPGLIRSMGVHDMRVSWHAGDKVAKLYGKDGLLQALHDENAYARAKAAMFLARFPVPDVEAALVMSAADPDTHVRMWTAYALGELSSPTVTPVLQRLATDPQEVVRIRATEALGKVQNRGRRK